MKKTVIEDPDFGEIALPPRPSRDDSERLVREQKSALARRTRLWPDGAVSDCPSCGKRAFVGRNDLSEEIPRTGGVVIFRHLQGARCTRCETQVLEPWESMQIDAEVGVGQVADYEAKVSNIGSGTVGTYWPKDVVRVLGLDPDKKAFIQILDRDTVLIKFRRARPSDAKGRTHAKRKNV